MAVNTSTKQTQSGADVSLVERTPDTTESTRKEPESRTVSTTETEAQTTTSVTAGTTSRTNQKERVGMEVSFTLKILSNPPPKALSS